MIAAAGGDPSAAVGMTPEEQSRRARIAGPAYLLCINPDLNGYLPRVSFTVNGMPQK